ncbi:MAG: PH domain-containing protein [Legionella sp.]|nr:PH domain-containing protein [Legionella sp.]
MSEKIDSNVVYTARLHWILFLGPVLFMLLILYAITHLFLLTGSAILLFLLGLAWLGAIWVTYTFSYLEIKPRKISLRTGIFVREIVDISMDKIESIDIRQSILGSILQYGSLVITGTGGSHRMIHYLKNPLTCRRYIEELMHQ